MQYTKNIIGGHIVSVSACQPGTAALGFRNLINDNTKSKTLLLYKDIRGHFIYILPPVLSPSIREFGKRSRDMPTGNANIASAMEKMLSWIRFLTRMNALTRSFLLSNAGGSCCDGASPLNFAMWNDLCHGKHHRYHRRIPSIPGYTLLFVVALTIVVRIHAVCMYRYSKHDKCIPALDWKPTLLDV